MDLQPLPFRAPLDQYQKQAEELLEGHRSGDSQAIKTIHNNHPRFLDSKVVWLPKDIPDSEIQAAAFDLADAQLALARWYDFHDWPALLEYVKAVIEDGPVFYFEAAVA